MDNLFLKWGLNIDASADEIRQCYKKRVQLLHPDKVGLSKKSQDDFVLLQEEYLILKDPVLKQRHIEELSVPQYSKDKDVADVSALKISRPVFNFFIPSSPLNVTLKAPLRSIAQGAKVYLLYQASRPCVCSRQHHCSICHGTGVVRVKTNLSLSLPRGIKNGSILAFPGRGHQGTHDTGTLFVHIRWSAMMGWRYDRPQETLKKKIFLTPLRVKSGVVWFRTPQNTFGFFTLSSKPLPYTAILPIGFGSIHVSIELKSSPWFRHPLDLTSQYLLEYQAKIYLWRKRIFEKIKAKFRGS